MRRGVLMLVCLMCWLSCLAQRDSTRYLTITGTVTDGTTGGRMPFVSVMAEKLATVSNEDGQFTLKVPVLPKYLKLSSVGYKTVRLPLREGELTGLKVRMQPNTVMLSEVMVWADNPLAIIQAAIQKIPENYSRCPELFKGFYRETVQKHRRFIHVAEAVTDLYKTSYNQTSWRDAVAIVKGRRLVSPRTNDTLSAKVVGGPVLPIQMDMVKEPEFLLDEKELAHYHFEMDRPVKLGERLQYVVSISPKDEMPYPLFFGKIYIDQQRLSFTRAELELDMRNQQKATSFILVRKPAGLRFKPREMSVVISYQTEDDVTRISYVRTRFHFNCDWKRRLFASAFTVTAEMVMTDWENGEGKRIKGRDSFGLRDAFFDKVEFFEEPDFWGSYNIIQPTESLEKAIGKLRKMNIGK